MYDNSNDVATVSYLKKTGNKMRLITTYKNNEIGKSMKIKHKIQLSYISGFLENNDLYFAYTKNKSTKMMAKKHINSKFFLHVDIKSFFPSINLNILKEKSTFLANKNLPKEVLYELIDSCHIINSNSDNGLAIGLVPSAFLSNVYLNDFDFTIDNYLKSIDENFIYSRYSDDIIISNSNQFDYNIIKEKIENELKPIHLELHESKTYFKDLKNYGDHFKVLGLNIVKGQNGNYISVSRKFKKSMQKEKNIFSKNGKKNYILYNEYNKKQKLS